MSDQPTTPIDCRRIGGDGDGQPIILSTSTIYEALSAVMAKWDRGDFKGYQDDISFWSANTEELRVAYKALAGKDWKKD